MRKTKPVAERFWSKVNKSTVSGCWEWTGAKHQWGYGRMYYQGKAVEAHRVGYELQIGPVPPCLFVCHKCDNPACVRGSHLFLGTNNDNRKDSVTKGRHARGDKTYARRYPEKLPRGERHPNAKLTETDVLEIRRVFKAGTEKKASLCRRFGVTFMSITHIVRGKTWKHLPL